MFSPYLGILIACAPLIVKQLLTWFAKTLSDEKHCRQYIQKCFLSLCLFGDVNGEWLSIFITKHIDSDAVLFFDFIVVFLG